MVRMNSDADGRRCPPATSAHAPVTSSSTMIRGFVSVMWSRTLPAAAALAAAASNSVTVAVAGTRSDGYHHHASTATATAGATLHAASSTNDAAERATPNSAACAAEIRYAATGRSAVRRMRRSRSASSTWLSAAAVNVAAAALCLFGNLFYVLIYTLVLKRRTSQNIVIGGAAGAIPPLVGWAAATGSLDLAALLLFAIVFLWTPPHFWALALLIRRDYERAEVPMLPVTEGERKTTNGIVGYTAALVVATLLFGPAAGVGAGYLVPVGIAGIVFAALAVALWRRPTPAAAGRLFKYSLLYLAVVFAAVAIAAG